MSRYIVDIETDGLLKTVSKTWIIGTLDIDTKEIKYWLDGDTGWKTVLDNAELIVGHNIIGFDLLALEKVHNYILPKSVRVHDTLIISQILDYNKFPNKSHSLKSWGDFLGYPKGEYEDWTQYTEEMLAYWKTDMFLTAHVYKYEMDLFHHIKEKAPQIGTYIKAEHAVSKWCAEAEYKGFPFDKENGVKLFSILEKELEETREELNKKLGTRVVPIDKKLGIYHAKACKWIKNGNYNSHTATWFDIDPSTGQDFDRLVEGSYTRVEIRPLSLDSTDDVKLFLFRNNWVPTEYNFKFDEATKKRVKTSPKITEDSLEFLGGDGKLYCEFLTTKSRYGIMKTFIEEVDENERLHGECMTIGTPSMRARHQIIVNLPSGEAEKDGTPVSKWGKEIRSLFKVKPGWKFIGADSSGNQARGLAHYLKDEVYTKILLEGDIHQYNADKLTEVLKGMGIDHVVPRPVAKRILYAFLFGAGGMKLWGYIFGVQDDKLGNKLKLGFQKAVPGLKDLLDKLSAIYASTSKITDGYIPSIAGNRIYCDSHHKLLVYLLQACEKVTCSAALMLTMEGLERENIPYQPLIFYHDEIDFMVPEEHATRAGEIAANAFKEGPKLFGVEIMDGNAKIGANWFECH